jgi:S-ribosylhomocysteine lyase LuxS involved in autoinducer biosynthesis
MRFAEHVALMGKRRGAYMSLMGRPEERRPLGRHKRRWEDNIKMDFQEVGWWHELD